MLSKPNTTTEMQEEDLKLIRDRRRAGLFCAVCDKTIGEIEDFEGFYIEFKESGKTFLVCNKCEETIPC